MKSESRKKNSIRNIAYGYGNYVVTLILKFVCRSAFIKILGERYLGINGLFSDVLMMLSMADLGFATAMAYSFYKPIAEKDDCRIASLVRFYRKIYNIIALTVCVVGVGLVPVLKYIVNLDKDIPYLKVYYLLYLSKTVISYLFVYKTSILNAAQKKYLISRYNTYVNIVRTITQVLILYHTKSFFLYVLVDVLSVLINNILSSNKAEKLYPIIKTQAEELDDNSKKEIWGNMKSIFLYKVSGVLINGTDNTLISIIIGTIWVGFYSNYLMIINAIEGVIAIFFNSLTSSIGNLIVTEKEEKRFEVFRIIQVLSFILSVIVVTCTYVLINDFIRIWLGEKYILNDIIVFAIICNLYLNIVLRPIWAYREASGLYMKTKYIMLITAIINLVLSVILGRIIGMAGILLASAIARLTTYCWYEPIVLFKDFFNQNSKKYFISVMKNVALVILVCGVSLLVFGRITVDSWIKIVIKAISVGIAASFGAMIFYFRSNEVQLLLVNMKKKIFR